MTGPTSRWLLESYPKDLDENLEFRCDLVVECKRDPLMAAAQRVKCASDILYWLNVWGWTLDPRKVGADSVLPFITYPFQDEAIRKMEEVFGRRDLVMPKSRGVGGTWMAIALFTHRWQFFPNMMFGLVSREEKAVDGGPKSLFAKVDFLLARQPRFLVPAFFRRELLLKGLENGSSIEGSSTTGQMFRGDRLTALLWDETAAIEVSDGPRALNATFAVTNCRYFISTPQGAVGAFYEVAHSPGYERHDLHWLSHPEMSRGKYQDQSGKWRSPWYDQECKRLVTVGAINQELNLDFAGSTSPFFPPDVIDKHLADHARPPLFVGRLEWDLVDHKRNLFVEDPDGDLRLWLPIGGPLWKPPGADQYVIGADISAGTGATNSVVSVADKRTREKVAELATARLGPGEFAELVIRVAWWFNEAFVIWEMNGPGGTFGKKLTDLGYRKLYFRQDEQGLEKKLAKNLVPGWHASPQNKQLVFRDYVAALAAGTFINRSREALQECRQYVYLPNGTVGNARATAISDPSGARQNHGDRPTADALANKALGVPAEFQRGAPQAQTYDEALKGPPAPEGSWLARRQRNAKEEADRTWDSNPDSGWEQPAGAMLGW